VVEVVWSIIILVVVGIDFVVDPVVDKYGVVVFGGLVVVVGGGVFLQPGIGWTFNWFCQQKYRLHSSWSS
jgi:hypothetical protein